MSRLFQLNTKAAVITYFLLDTLCVGAGMGVPLLCILFGFFVGWYIVRRKEPPQVTTPGWEEQGFDLTVGQLAAFTENGLMYLDRPMTAWHAIK